MPWLQTATLSLLVCAGICGLKAAEDPTAPALPDESAQNKTEGTPTSTQWLKDPATPKARPVAGPDTPDTPAKPTDGPEMTRVAPLPARAPAVQAIVPASTPRDNEDMKSLVDQMFEKAEQSYKKKDYSGCEAICQSILAAEPRYIDAAKLLAKARNKLTDADEAVTNAALDRSNRQAYHEADQKSVRPQPKIPEDRPHFQRREEDPTLAKRKKISELLEQPITVDFMNADLEYVFNILFDLTGANIVADPAALQGKTLTLHVKDIALKSVLDFIVRNNDKIQYSITDDAVWITANTAKDMKSIMIPKVYPLHTGLVSTTDNTGNSAGQRAATTGRAGTGQNQQGLQGSIGGQINNGIRGQNGQQQGAQPQQGGGQGGKGQNGQQQQEPSYLEVVLKWLHDQKDPQTFPEGSEYIIDRQSNQILVLTTPAGHKHIQEFLDYFDQQAIQVLIKARFLEIDLEANKSIGFNLQQLGTKLGGLSVKYQGESSVLGSNTLGVGSLLTLTGLRTDPTFNVIINALMNDKKTTVLSEPQVLAINNKQAFLDVTQYFSYTDSFNVQTGPSTVSNGTVVTEDILVPVFGTEKVGFTLTVTPSVGRDLKTINLHLNPVLDNLVRIDNIPINNSQGSTIFTAQRPVIDQSSVETDVVIEDNGYVILGGLIRNFVENTERKIPGLHRIPYLGMLFKQTNTTKTVKNLVIVVEAQIVTSRGRTYKDTPPPDAVDVREGGIPRLPLQTNTIDQPPGPRLQTFKPDAPKVEAPLQPENPVVPAPAPVPAKPDAQDSQPNGRPGRWTLSPEEASKKPRIPSDPNAKAEVVNVGE